MITKEILKIINSKLRSVVIYMVIIGLLFFILAIAILFYPQVLQFLFVVSFSIVSFMAFMIAIKISHIKKHFEDSLLLFSKKRKARKKRK